MTDAPAALQPLLRLYQEEVDALMDRLANGRLSVRRWQQAMQELLARYHMAAMMVGMGTTQLGAPAVRLLEETLNTGQFPYLANFAAVIAGSDEFQNRWRARARLYALSPKTSYWEGSVFQAVGRFLPLPAMPAQGTQCATNCGCSWRIVTLDAAAGDYDAYWERGKTDSCQTCIQRERDWNPVQIRNGLLLLDPLPAGEFMELTQ